MSLYRVLGDEGQDMQPTTDKLSREEWLDYCQVRYDALVMELRYYDDELVKGKRKRHLLLPKRVK